MGPLKNSYLLNFAIKTEDRQFKLSLRVLSSYPIGVQIISSFARDPDLNKLHLGNLVLN